MPQSCWFIPMAAPVFCLLGRYGDLIQLMPAFAALRERFGSPPTVVVSDEYSSVFDGVSYAKPYVLHTHWWTGLQQAKEVAESLAGDTICPAFWQDFSAPEFKPSAFKGGMVLQSHGRSFGVNINFDPDYGTSMWRRAGFTRADMMRLPLVFDRRSPEREEELYRTAIGSDKRPVLLYNFVGISSPFGYTPEVINPIMHRFGRALKLVDLGKMRAKRIYDMVGLMDRAIGLITTDTATLHLAAASNTPYVAFTVNGWTSSVPKGNCVLEIKYSEGSRRVGDVLKMIELWSQANVDSPLEPIHA